MNMRCPAACDICVIGGGPAGLATAIALRRHGYQVLVADCSVPPIDKACGEGLMPDSLAALRELGVSTPEETGFPFRGVQFLSGNVSVAADFPGACGLGVRRTALHQLLLQCAEHLQVAFIWNAKHVKWTRGSVSIDGSTVKTNFVIGADGHHSRVRKQAGFRPTRKERVRYGFRRHYRVAPWSSYVQLYWSPRCQIYVTPVATDEVGIALLSRDPKLRIDEGLTEFPHLRERLENAAHASSEMGGLSVSRTLHRVYGPGVALVGDASGSVDAVTGQGLGLCFRQAIALASALKSRDLAEYQKQHAKISSRPRQMARLMLALDGRAELQRRVLASLAKRPDVFASVLSLHIGTSSFMDLCSWPLLDFGVSLLAV